MYRTIIVKLKMYYSSCLGCHDADKICSNYHHNIGKIKSNAVNGEYLVIFGVNNSMKNISSGHSCHDAGNISDRIIV